MYKKLVIGIFIIAAVAVAIIFLNSTNITGEAIFDSDRLNEDLISYYRFDELGTNDAKRANDGDAYGDIQQITDGKAGYAYTFDGVDDYINIGRPEDFTKAVTFAAWIRMPKQEKGGVIYERGGMDNGYQVFSDKDGRLSLRYRWEQGDYAGYQTCKDGLDRDDEEWHHVVGVLDIEWRQITLYVDGIEECNDIIVVMNKPVVDVGYIGSHGTATVKFAGYFNGDIDEVGIWNRDLDSKEVKELYNSYLPDEEKLD